MPSGSMTGDSASCSPAPYGQACAGCSRAKCKCFYRSDGSSCERCHRLGKTCQPALALRKRKARTPPPPPTQHPPPVNSRLEEKLDDLVSLLRSQAGERQGQHQTLSQRHTPQSTSEGTPGGYGESISSMSVHENPDVVLDTAACVVHLLRPVTPPMSPSPLYDDISIHRLPERIAEEQLESFRRSFLSTFPFIHIPATTSAAELRHEKPFLWLIIMALTEKTVAQQFAMEATIWHIVSRRIVAQHFANLDLLLGVICFASWSHFFKKDKPFMTMLSQIAISLALELGIHRNPSTTPLRRSRLPTQLPERQRPRTMEERRTMLAVFHLSSSSWTTYRMTDPLRWTSYLEECLRLCSEGRETHLDILLTAQIKCQIITNHLSCAPYDEIVGLEGPKASSAALTTALLRQLNDIRQSLPADIASYRTVQFYLLHTELRIRESALGRPRSQDQTGLSQFQRSQDLESVLSTIERWFMVYSEMPLSDWIGFTADIFTQFMQFLVVNFKLSILDEPGWDVQEVRRRADVFEKLDRACENVERVPTIVGMVDADGPRRGFFFKITALLRSVKALFLAEMPSPAAFPTPENSTDANDINIGASEAELMDFSFSDEILLGMLQDDILSPAWDFRVDSSYMPFPS
ncbi:uncharacterized protein GGS22DRAFT_147291 [Annulohypoxylon maeteangense]|uniref:uncharacterized protein n=1 Tax=Annulohypoxylon maeteangense TaxID=1927788 RepID=UPI002008A0D0|nr:uncharacterized protein GGS22DRAFT_147291 [Annulohypoxylon maeteangense]KAI0884830.1 hypothetical protein GGS22DRAFT_147291 [Annulohypoxylon maeteangense]